MSITFHHSNRTDAAHLNRFAVKPVHSYVRYLYDGQMHKRFFDLSKDSERLNLMRLIHWAAKNDVELRIFTE